MPHRLTASALVLLLCAASAQAQEPAAFDAAKAQAWGANAQGLRAYTLVLLKTGPTPMAAGPARDEMFKGHFANMARLAKEGMLVYAGPLDGKDGLRGLFIFATNDLEAARNAVDTDPSSPAARWWPNCTATSAPPRCSR
ncbi:MAG: hypothetical protein EOP35_11695 [Rubrivivax sp.]|nr:MAG: hypothetical protein EOP35_11695 [Rubrivivax sp.]